MARSERLLDQGDLRRRYILHVPDGAATGVPLPLVLAFHGGGGTADNMDAADLMHSKGNGAGYVVAYPDGHHGSWNAGPGPDRKSPNYGAAFEADLDDVGLVRRIVDDIDSVQPIDRARVHATGWSNGSAMSQRLACEAADLIASVLGFVSELSLPDPSPSRPVPITYIYGTDDPIQRPGSPTDKDEMAARCIAAWRQLNNCGDVEPTTRTVGAAECTSWAGPPGGADVVQWRINGGGHWWPGLLIRSPDPARTAQVERTYGPLNHDISATDEALTFFAAHPMP